MIATPPEGLRLHRASTPIGEALMVTDRDGYPRALDWADCQSSMRRLLRLHYGDVALEEAAAPPTLSGALRDYFDGDIGCLATIAWRTAGTSFQQTVWAALTAISPGTTLSYRGLAAKLGMPKAVRAVGAANGANPISIVVPCHRVVGSDGSLVGYGGGLERKRWLLRHEAVNGTMRSSRPAAAEA
jgi:methylated-DNA-[protein]-cysteine S-methyltransferase